MEKAYALCIEWSPEGRYLRHFWHWERNDGRWWASDRTMWEYCFIFLMLFCWPECPEGWLRKSVGKVVFAQNQQQHKMRIAILNYWWFDGKFCGWKFVCLYPILIYCHNAWDAAWWRGWNILCGFLITKYIYVSFSSIICLCWMHWEKWSCVMLQFTEACLKALWACA